METQFKPCGSQPRHFAPSLHHGVKKPKKKTNINEGQKQRTTQVQWDKKLTNLEVFWFSCTGSLSSSAAFLWVLTQH